MKANSRKKYRLATAAGQVFLAVLLLVSAGVYAGARSAGNGEERPKDSASQPESESYSAEWTSSDEQLVLLSRVEAERQEVCPHLANERRQPFCRQFGSPMVDACGDHQQIVIVLANGDLHRVNSALIGKDGDFEPAYESSGPVHLVKAWFPGEDCNTLERLPVVMAVEATGRIWHFDGARWNAVSTQAVSQQ